MRASGVVRFVLAVGLLAGPGRGSGAAQTDDLPKCYYTSAPGTVAKAEMAGGFVATLTRSSDRDAADDACTVRVLAPGGAIVYERAGFGAAVRPPTGADLDADGVPDAVLSVDDGGGNRCCWGTVVLRLATTAAVVLDVPFLVSWQLDPPRGALAEETVAYYGLGPSMAETPTATRIHRLTRTGLQDRTRDFCDRILSGAVFDGLGRRDPWPELTPERRRASRAGTDADFDVSQTRVSAMSMALQYLECGRTADADALVADVWPAVEVRARRRIIADGFAARRPK